MAKDAHSGATPGTPLATAAWLHTPALLQVLGVLEANGGAARVVGGAVRNALLGEPITDIDIATPLTPQEVMARGSAAGLGVHPTGIDHGTITLVANGHPFEVTTLRRDVETDGRRAVVAFSSDWREDAERRDFTMNALYAARDGTVYDYFGGLADLAVKRIRFIGSAEQRIREDYLRILRFFRFHAQYGHGDPEPDGLAACVRLKDGIVRLSAERIGAEMMKLLAAPGAAAAITVMADTSILATVLGPRTYPSRLERLVQIEAATGLKADALTRLAALTLDGPEAASHLAQHLRLANTQAEALARAAQRHAAFDPATPEAEARIWLYKTGADAYARAALVAWAESAAGAGDVARKERAILPQRWSPPVLPVRGADVLALGVPAGPRVGEVLKAFENWWISADFTNDAAVQKAKLLGFARAS